MCIRDRAETLKALEFVTGKPARVVLVGEERMEDFIKASWSGVRNNLVVIGTEGPVSSFTKTLKEAGEGKTTAYYCVGQTCRLPETDPAVLAGWLKEDRSGQKSTGREAQAPPLPQPE